MKQCAILQKSVYVIQKKLEKFHYCPLKMDAKTIKNFQGFENFFDLKRGGLLP